MDKKNTMLLTVIAVATLLVAVVGATFAYFAISTQGTGNSKTTVTGSTPEAVADSAIALNGNKSLKLKLSAENMALANKGHYFYATESDTPEEETSESNPTAHKVAVGTASITGGAEGATYECKAQYKVTMLQSEGGEAIEDWTFDDTEDEAVLFLYGEAGKVTVGDALNPSSAGLKLSALKTAGTAGITGEVVFKLNGGSSDTAKLEAALQIKNANTPRQEEIAGKSFVVQLEATTFTCDAATTE